LAQKGVNAGVNFGADKLKDFVGKKISGLGAKRGRGLLGGDKGKFKILPVAVTPTPVIAPDSLDIAVHHPQMLSIRGAKPTAKMEGEGFFDSVLDFTGDTITKARDVALAGAYQRLAGRGLKGAKTTGRGRPKKKTTGGSFKLPGN
jgi:hypothetical protein